MRIPCALLAGLLLVVPAVRAGDDGLKGTWQVSLFEQGQQLSFWLLKLDKKDGKVTGTVQAAKGFLASSLEKVRVEGGKLLFTIKADKIGTIEFDCVLPKAGAKDIRGSLQVMANKQLAPVRLDRSTAESLEIEKKEPLAFTYEKARELLAKHPDDPHVFDASPLLFREAKANKASAEEVKGWAETLVKAAAAYGPRWHQETALRVAGRLAAADTYPALAEEAAQRAIEIVGNKGSTAARLRAFSVLETVLKKAGKDKELKAVRTRLNELEEVAHKKYSKTALPFKPEAVAPRKDAGKRVVLVELFTGAECPPCVAADLAFDGLEHAYKPSEVVLLQYHLHIPRPDPLTNPHSEARQTYYEKVRGTPTIFFNGKFSGHPVGGPMQAEKRYKEYREAITPILGEASKTRVEAEAVRKGDKIDITATVSDLEKPGEKVKLRLVLVEEWVRYQGGNRLPYHSRVVRDMPGGAAGLALTKATGKQTATVDLGELRRKLTKYLDDEGSFRNKLRPMRLHDLRVVAFVQNDETQEVLQAVEVQVNETK